MLKDNLAALFLCVTLVVCCAIAAVSFKNRNRANDLISVTGATKQDFVSDLIEWKMDVVRRDLQLKSAFQAIKNDTETARKFIIEKGMTPEEVVISAVSIEREYENEIDSKGNRREKFKGFKLTQNIRIESSDVEKVEKLSREISSLIDSGLEVSSSAPNYYYTKLGELKIQMIAEATKDGTTRAEQIAKNAGGKRGSLRFSSLGIFQITGQNTNPDYSWGGAFDTASKRKTASITVKLQFAIE